MYLLFLMVSQRKEDVSEEGEDNARGGMDLEAGVIRSYNLILCLD